MMSSVRKNYNLIPVYSTNVQIEILQNLSSLRNWHRWSNFAVLLCRVYMKSNGCCDDFHSNMKITLILDLYYNLKWSVGCTY